MPPLIIVAILAAIGTLGLGTGSGVSQKQIEQEVTALLDRIPQNGTILGSPRAPVTLWIYADLECPTVKLFVENYLPSLIDGWVRTGEVKFDYRSLETDTSNEELFFEQEKAALAAGRQDLMWNFALTFVREQGEPRTSYVTDRFLREIASQVPGLRNATWQDDRADARLSKRVALGVYSGHARGLRYTPSFLIGFNQAGPAQSLGDASTEKQLATTLKSVLKSLKKETREDFPTLKTIGSGLLEGKS